MSMMNNLKSGLSDMKSRTLLFVMLIAVGFLGIVVFFAYNKATQTTSNSQSSNSRISNPAANIQSIPGVSQTSSEEYRKLQAQKTQDEAEKALQTGGSDVSPILSPGSMNKSLSQLQSSENENGDASRVSNLLNNSNNQQNEALNKLQAQLKAQQKAQEEQLARQRQEQEDQLMRQQEALKRQQYRQDLAQQIRRLGFSPNAQPVSQHVVYAEKPKKQDRKTQSHIAQKHTPPKIIYKAGTMLQGILLSSINSDSPAPILAQVVNGPLRGARLVGSIDEKSIPKTSLAVKVSKALVLNFNVISIPQLPYSIKVKAIAINPDTASSSIATDVDNHYLMRYGTFLGATFLSGLSQAIQQSGQQIVAIPNTNNGTNQNQLAIQHPTTSKKQQIEIAVGNAMQQLVSQVNYLGTPPTIKIASGTAIGLLLLEDLTEQTPADTMVQKVSETTTVTHAAQTHNASISSDDSDSDSTLSQINSSLGNQAQSSGNNASNSNTSSSSNTNNANNSRILNDSFQQQIGQLNNLVGG